MAGGVEVGVESKVRKRNGKINGKYHYQSEKGNFFIVFPTEIYFRNESKIYFF